MTPTLDQRASGVLLHPTSLPGGSLGPSARAFVDYLAAAGQSWWQMLPVGPAGYGGSPYDSPSSFAGSPALISLEDLRAQGWLDDRDCRLGRKRPDAFLRKAHAAFARSASNRRRLTRFCELHSTWLDDWCLYRALKEAHQSRPWFEWPAPLARRKQPALSQAARELSDEVRFHAFVQFCFASQWDALRERAAAAGVGLMGDIPMFVAHDGADVWANQDLFFLDRRGHKTVVAGVPPDLFSADGQLWGNPLYRWTRMKQRDFAWWRARIRTQLSRFDALRIDHFIGLSRYWEVPALAAHARDGRFVSVPGHAFLASLRKDLGSLPLIAEDLGILTPEVCALRDAFELPGMRVLQFAFGDPAGSDYLPHRFVENTVVYTGTHDNDTLVGWLDSLKRNRAERERLERYLGGHLDPWSVVRLASASVARLAIFPLQDLLALGSESRMNLPGTSTGNWGYRVQKAKLSEKLARQVAELTRTYERDPTPGRGNARAFQAQR